ncbi:hypothetical protein IJ076_00015 [Candidatus Saccharibacteria bacterium]|nr:hypothetical protein [Candidatus Saccharibacteria bacterium]
MKKLFQKFATAFAVFLASISILPATLTTTSAYAADTPPAVILTGCAGKENGSGEGIICIIVFVINILNVVVGILGILGIVIVGIQYLTAGGDEGQVRKAKRRLFEIIIGIVVYVVIAALLNWLLPNFALPDQNTSMFTTSIGA